MKLNSALIAAAALMILPQAAFADSTKTAENIATCSAEIESSIATNEIEFEAVRGNSRLQTLTFTVDADGKTDTIKCKVRRKGAVEIVWGKTVKPEMAKSVEVKAETNAGE